MKTCLVTTAQPVDYSRFYHREAATLAAHGLAVTLVGLPAVGRPAAIPGVTLQPVVLPSGVRKTTRLQPVRELVEAGRPDVCHCFDPWALRVGLDIKRRRPAVKVIYDSTELFPAVYRDRADLSWPVRAFAGAVVRSVERRAAREADAIIETNATRAERFRRLGREPLLVRNYPPRPTRPLADRPPTGCIVWTGLVSYPRGFDVLLKAFAEVAPGFPVARLEVCGRFDPGTDIEHWAQEFLRARRLADRVEFSAWLPYSELLARLEGCDVGVILLQPGRENDYTGQPNKLFEFMAAGLALLASDFPEIGPVVSETGCGLAVDPTSPGAVADALRELLADPARAAGMGRLGRAAVEREHNWDAAAARLTELYDRLLDPAGTPGAGR
ncbi:MAG: glycosyltransferase family 4 protein [bacterium]